MYSFVPLHFTDEKMEAPNAGHMWQFFSHRNCERWGVTLPAGNSSQMVPVSLQFPERSSLRSDWWWKIVPVTMGRGCLQGPGGTWEVGEWGNAKQKSKSCFISHLSGDGWVLTFVTQEWGSVRMICVCHRSWWKHPEHWGIGRVHPDKWWLKR